MRTLIVGLSTRAIAESAVLDGHEVVTLDYFGDRDQRALVENYALRREFGLPFSAPGLLQASRRLSFDAVAYLSNLENHPEVVEGLARERVLLGNKPAALRQVRDWRTLRTFCQRRGIPCPTVLLPGEEEKADPSCRWLRKPARGGGGRGVRPWLGEPLNPGDFLQSHIDGRSASAAFVADARRSVVIGLTEQLIGQEELGGRGFAWCGNILPLALGPTEGAAVLLAVDAMAAKLTRRFGLRGVNGMDLVLANGSGGQLTPYLVEVNPRYTASMELVERACGLRVFSLHLAAFSGNLPDFSLAEHLQGPFLAKGIVFARRDVTIPETEGWVNRGRRDVPFSGERIGAGHPVCTVLAEGKNRDACWRHLLAAVESVRREIGDESGGLY
jgi:hypothetical protein